VVAMAATPPNRLSGLGSQCRLGERIELVYHRPRNAEDLSTASAEGHPFLEGGNPFGAQAFNQRVRQIGWQCV
jgi:hypothetical protein